MRVLVFRFPEEKTAMVEQAQGVEQREERTVTDEKKEYMLRYVSWPEWPSEGLPDWNPVNISTKELGRVLNVYGQYIECLKAELAFSYGKRLELQKEHERAQDTAYSRAEGTKDARAASARQAEDVQRLDGRLTAGNIYINLLEHRLSGIQERSRVASRVLSARLGKDWD